jgi:hypothetical protein
MHAQCAHTHTHTHSVCHSHRICMHHAQARTESIYIYVCIYIYIYIYIPYVLALAILLVVRPLAVVHMAVLGCHSALAMLQGVLPLTNCTCITMSDDCTCITMSDDSITSIRCSQIACASLQVLGHIHVSNVCPKS